MPACTCMGAWQREVDVWRLERLGWLAQDDSAQSLRAPACTGDTPSAFAGEHVGSVYKYRNRSRASAKVRTHSRGFISRRHPSPPVIA